MTRKLTIRKSTADSPRPSFKHQGVLGEKIIEQDGKKFRVEILGGKEFNLPLDKRERVSWKSMTSEERIAYSIAYCKHNNCGISDLPGALSHVFYSSQEEMRKVLEGIGRPTEKTEFLNGKEFKLPLDVRGVISWKSISSKQRIKYVVAFCKHNNCGFKGIPSGLKKALFSNPKEKQRILEKLGRKKEKLETWDGIQFKLPLDSRGEKGNIAWRNMTSIERINYTVAYLKDHDHKLEELPYGLLELLRSHPKEMREVLEGIGRKSEITEIIGEVTFTLPLDSSGRVYWKIMPSDDRVKYAIAFCKYHNCGTGGLPSALQVLLDHNPKEKQRVSDGLGRKKERTETLCGQIFIIPLNAGGNVSWKSMTPEQRLAYAIAFCKQNACGVKLLPGGLRLNLTREQRKTIIERLFEPTDSAQLTKLAKVMEEF